MKFNRYSLAVIGGALLLLCGCGTPSVQRQAVNTLYTVHKSVDTAYDTYLDLVVAKVAPVSGVRNVNKEYNNFQLVYNAAVTIVAGNTNAPAPPNVLEAAGKVNTAIDTAKKGN